jgi:hypothetical protein
VRIFANTVSTAVQDLPGTKTKGEKRSDRRLNPQLAKAAIHPDSSARTKGTAKKTGPGADVGNHHSRLEIHLVDNTQPVVSADRPFT